MGNNDLILRQPLNKALLAWWDAGHADLPWRRTKDPYAIWISEIMLQQTQIATVIPYYERWLDRFSSVQALAAAPLADVLKLWEGLGYYSRARNLHVAAQTVVAEYHGQFPQTVAGLQKLKGIGRYTAGAIASIAFGEPAPVLDGNVIRVLSRLTDLPDDTTTTATKNKLWALAEQLVAPDRPGAYNQALMELGQTICLPRAPRCHDCPLADLCLARARGTQMERPVRPPRRQTPHYDVVAAIIWRDASTFLIAQRPLDGLLGGLWEFPGGKLEAGETQPVALVREIQEELALTVRVRGYLTSIKHAYTHFRITLHAYHVDYLGGAPQHLGVADHRWVTLADVDQYAFAKTDLQIIAALRSDQPRLPLG
ncbi:MAG: A/G-specific adenine glycosylase [Anaerolineales bacterium]|nr:A/G-specific adenine glycosylase [Anaerolineales bacterium]